MDKHFHVFHFMHNLFHRLISYINFFMNDHPLKRILKNIYFIYYLTFMGYYTLLRPEYQGEWSTFRPRFYPWQEVRDPKQSWSNIGCTASTTYPTLQSVQLHGAILVMWPLHTLKHGNFHHSIHFFHSFILFFYNFSFLFFSFLLFSLKTFHFHITTQCMHFKKPFHAISHIRKVYNFLEICMLKPHELINIS